MIVHLFTETTLTCDCRWLYIYLLCVLGMYMYMYVCGCMSNLNHISLKTVGLYVTQSHSLCWTCFGQYQALSAALERQGDGDGYLMHRMQSSGWPCPYHRQKLLKCSISLCSCACTCIVCVLICSGNKGLCAQDNSHFIHLLCEWNWLISVGPFLFRPVNIHHQLHVVTSKWFCKWLNTVVDCKARLSYKKHQSLRETIVMELSLWTKMWLQEFVLVLSLFTSIFICTSILNHS